MKMDTTQFDDWRYSIRIHDDNQGIDLSVDEHGKQIPNTLVKYYSLSEYSVDAFTHRKFYASQPSQLNDLFDAHLRSVDFSGMSKRKFANVYEISLAELEHPEHPYSKDRNGFLRKFANTMSLIWSKHFGVLSATPAANSDLMWAHYTQNQGFALVFDTNKLGPQFLGPFPVKYKPKPAVLTVSEQMPGNLALFITALLKKDVWQYENEFRYLVRPDQKQSFRLEYPWDHVNVGGEQEQSRLVSYNKSAIQKVLLGFNFHHRYIKYKSEKIIDLSPASAHLHKTLIDYLNTSGIPTEIMYMDVRDYALKSFPVSFKPTDQFGHYKMVDDTR